MCDTTKQKILSDGTCESCPACTMPNPFAVPSYSECANETKYDECMETVCNWDEQIYVDSKCKTCEPCTSPKDMETCEKEDNYLSCMSTACEWTSQFLNSSTG